MMKPENYNVGKNSEGEELFSVHLEWYDENGSVFEWVSDDIESTQNVLGLLSGELGFGDFMS